jgi:eukaryotic-like serine/threonine-protein kinase
VVPDCPELDRLKSHESSVLEHIAGCGSCRILKELLGEREREVAARDAHAECGRFEMLIAVREAGSLGANAAKLLDEHLRVCSACNAVARTLPPRRASSSHLERESIVATGSDASLLVPHAAEARAAPSDPADIVLSPGSRVRQYEVIREIGRGGMGRVVLARDTKLGRRVAMKFLATSSPVLTERFLVEARTTALLTHENVVVIHEVDEHQGVPYMVLEYLTGSSLRSHLGRPLPAGRTVELAVPIVRALVRAHEAGIVHRDLKPENVFVTDEGTIKVLDFGIAKLVSDAAAPARGRAKRSSVAERMPVGLTGGSALLGTLPYMSPEQFEGSRVDHQSDLWAVGIMLYEMVTGTHPISLTSSAMLMGFVPDLDRPMPGVLRAAPDLPERLERAIDRCLMKPRDARFASARELLAELEPLLPIRRGRQLTDDECPYPGLTSFQEPDADRFFGRGRDVARTMVRLGECSVVAVVGPSGAGKSSFVRAGVVPALKGDGKSWDIRTLRPGPAPLASLAAHMADLVSHGGDRELAKHDDLVTRFVNEPGYFGTRLREHAAGRNTNILLFIDQFEELYTLGADPAERGTFTDCLAALADDQGGPIRVVLTMRSDFLDRLVEHREFLDEVTRGLVFLEALAAPALREALVQPVAMRGYRFEDTAMVDEMVTSLAARPGSLPLLQFAAARLWETRDRVHKCVTKASYERMGGIAGALATHADQVLAALPSPSQRLARQLFERLVTSERTRALVELDELRSMAKDVAELDALVDHLVAARLLVVHTLAGAGATAVEIVHEALISSWPALRRWLDEGNDDAAHLAQLRVAAVQWEQRGRDQGLLWRGEALADARAWHARYRGQLTGRERAFLDAGVALATRAARMRRWVVIAVIAILSVGVAGTTVALVMIRDAEQMARQRAEEASRAKVQAEQETARAHKEAARAVAAERIAQERLDEVRTAEMAREQAQEIANERGKTIEMTKEELKAALATAEREKLMALEQERNARATARLAEEAAGREREAKDEARQLYLKEKARADEAEKLRAKITTELPK